MLKNYLFKRPEWFKHEGYWRLAQVFRIGPTFIFLAISVFCAGAIIVFLWQGRVAGDAAELALSWFAGAVAYVVVMHWLIRLIVWITDGFKEAGKS